MWHWNMMNQRLKMSHEGAAQVWHFQLSKWETVSLIMVNLKRNEDPRLRRPVRDLTSGASADDFKLYSSTAHNHHNIQWQHHSSIQSTVAAVIHSISILTAIFHSRWTHEKEVAPFMSAFRYETLVEPTRRLKMIWVCDIPCTHSQTLCSISASVLGPYGPQKLGSTKPRGSITNWLQQDSEEWPADAGSSGKPPLNKRTSGSSI